MYINRIKSRLRSYLPFLYVYVPANIAIQVYSSYGSPDIGNIIALYIMAALFTPPIVMLLSHIVNDMRDDAVNRNFATVNDFLNLYGYHMVINRPRMSLMTSKSFSLRDRGCQRFIGGAVTPYIFHKYISKAYSYHINNKHMKATHTLKKLELRCMENNKKATLFVN